MGDDEFEWDDAKNLANIEKHGIGFDEAKRIFDRPVHTIDSERGGEHRLKSIGMIDDELLIVVIHVDRSGRVRIISARRATRKERHAYQAAVHTSSDD